jgi:hypothetical protein
MSSLKKQIPDEFKKVIFEFLADISNTFPEYKNTLGLFLDSKGINISKNETTSESDTEKVVEILYGYCSKVYPERFFDILYKNEKIFDNGKNDNGKNCENVEYANINTHFLPNINFKVLWNTEGISDTTRETIWKYLQLILMTIITNIDDKKSFGDAANLFEAINEDELRDKLEETIQQMYKMFESGNGENGPSETEGVYSGNDSEQQANSKEFNFFEWAKNINKQHGDVHADGAEHNASAESIHDHISHILNGKIGKLAKEIAEETAKDVDFNMDLGGESGENMDFKNVFQKMFKNPGKLMSLVKNVGSKLDEKFKSGEIKESELMQEASDLLSKMKGMPGMNNLADLLNKMGMSGMMGGMGGGKSKVNIGAMQSHLQRNAKLSQMKERMQQKLKVQQQQREAALAAANATTATATSNIVKTTTPQVFSTGEVVERTPIEASRLPSNANKKKKKK